MTPPQPRSEGTGSTHENGIVRETSVKRFNPISDTRPVIELVRPMFGLETISHFRVEPWGEDASPFLLLTAIEEPAIQLVVVSPDTLWPAYSPELPDEDAEALKVQGPEDVVVFVVCALGETVRDATANLLAPIVVNWRTLAAAQVVLYGSSYPVSAPLVRSTAIS